MSSDPYSQIIGGGLGTAGTAISTFGLDKSAKAEEEAAQALALLIREQTLIDTERERRQNRRQIGQMRGQIARSGISLEGSQLDLLLTNARELELNAIYIERFGKAAADQADNKAKAIGTAATYGRAAGIVASFKSGGQAAEGIYKSTAQRSPTPQYSPSNPAPFGKGAGVLRPEYGGGANALGPGGG